MYVLRTLRALFSERRGRNLLRGGVFAIAFALLLHVPATFANDALWKALQAGGYGLLIRHASTDPGAGDPPGFKLDDCATQRNLNTAGRTEARRLGAEFERRGIPVGEVLSSRWCRCTETAQLAFARVSPWPALDNTFEQPQRREPQMREVRERLAQSVSGGNLVLMTHGVNIQALTGISPAPAEIVIVRPGAKFEVIGRLGPF
jgi:phosphohistidine phosphatase SixA